LYGATKVRSLGLWVGTQRASHANNKLRVDRKDILDKIGFAWKADADHTFKPDDKLWYQQYERLVEFKRKKGHCMVPRKYEQDKSLGPWVSTQRKHHINNKLRLDRKDILDKIGFAWTAEGAQTNYDDKLWHQQCEKLVEFKRINGHCRVPQKFEQDASLGLWVSAQRKNHNNNKLLSVRKEVLDEIGFAWKADAAHQYKPDDQLWHQQYEKLLEYKRKNGHCKVPNKYKDDKSLGLWVMNQRARHANNKMLPDRKELLDALDFVWWKADSLATRASTTDVRGFAI
jgi:hypothetical protein